MARHDDPLSILTNLIAEVRAAAWRRIPQFASKVFDAPAEPAAVVAARRDLTAAFAAWDRAHAALGTVAGDLAAIRTDPRWSPAERARLLGETVAQARAVTDTELTTISTAAANLAGTLARIGTPARPTGSIADQEATLARAERAIERELDALRAPEEAVDVLDRELRAALVAPDPLRVWWIATDGSFAASYFRARGWAEALPLLEARISTALDAYATDDVALARQLRAWVAGPDGLDAVAQAARAYVRMLLDDLGADRTAA